MVREVESRRGQHGVVQLPSHSAVTMAKEMIDEGRLGKVYHYRSNFLQD